MSDASEDFVMLLGKYKGETLDQIASDDEGLKYLDWIVGQEWIHGRTREAIEGYLDQPTIKRELDRILED